MIRLHPSTEVASMVAFATPFLFHMFLATDQSREIKLREKKEKERKQKSEERTTIEKILPKRQSQNKGVQPTHPQGLSEGTTK